MVDVYGGQVIIKDKGESKVFKFKVEIQYTGHARKPTRKDLKKWLDKKISTSHVGDLSAPFKSETVRLKKDEKLLPGDYVVYSVKKRGQRMVIRLNDILVKVTS